VARIVVEGGELSADQAAVAMDRIMSGSVTPAQIGALVTALRMRGETVEEIAGFASAMRQHALRVSVDLDDEWHMELIADCPNKVLLDLIKQFIQRTRRYEIALMREQTNVALATANHKAILAALRNSDAVGP
jgi:DNA-binding GntR family transcriptional regulator